MKTALFITAVLASSALAEPAATPDVVPVPLHGVVSAKDVLSWGMKLTGKNMRMDPRVLDACGVDVRAPATLSHADAYQLFLLVLDKMEIAVVPYGSILRLVRTHRHPSAYALPAVLRLPRACSRLSVSYPPAPVSQ